MADAGPRFDPILIRRACGDGDICAIIHFSNILSTHIRHREARIRKGAVHVVSKGEFLGDSIIGNFAYRMCKACHREGIAPPVELIELLQLVLKQDRKPSRSDRRYLQRLHAMEYIEQHPTAGVREIARTVGVAPSTVTRWKRDDKL